MGSPSRPPLVEEPGVGYPGVGARTARPSVGSAARQKEANMGLLDELLGGLARGGLGQGMDRSRSAAGGGASSVLMALLPVVLSMLASRQGRGAPALAPGGPGGLGGLGGLLEQLRGAGYGAEAYSWVSTGNN